MNKHFLFMMALLAVSFLSFCSISIADDTDVFKYKVEQALQDCDDQCGGHDTTEKRNCFEACVHNKQDNVVIPNPKNEFLCGFNCDLNYYVWKIECWFKKSSEKDTCNDIAERSYNGCLDTCNKY